MLYQLSYTPAHPRCGTASHIPPRDELQGGLTDADHDRKCCGDSSDRAVGPTDLPCLTADGNPRQAESRTGWPGLPSVANSRRHTCRPMAGSAERRAAWGSRTGANGSHRSPRKVSDITPDPAWRLRSARPCRGPCRRPPGPGHFRSHGCRTGQAECLTSQLLL